MKNLLNKLYYCIYLLDIKLHFLSNKINPFFYLPKIPFLKKRYEKLGVDVNEEVNKVFTDKEYGFSVMVSEAVLSLTFFQILLSVIFIMLGILDIRVTLRKEYFIILALSSYLFCYLLVFKNNEYLKYFKRYASWTSFEKRKNVLLTLGFILLTTTLSFLCIFYFNYLFHHL